MALKMSNTRTGLCATLAGMSTMLAACGDNNPRVTEAEMRVAREMAKISLTGDDLKRCIDDGKLVGDGAAGVARSNEEGFWNGAGKTVTSRNPGPAVNHGQVAEGGFASKYSQCDYATRRKMADAAIAAQDAMATKPAAGSASSSTRTTAVPAVTPQQTGDKRWTLPDMKLPKVELPPADQKAKENICKWVPGARNCEDFKKEKVKPAAERTGGGSGGGQLF